MKVLGFFWFRNAEEYAWLRAVSEDRADLFHSYSRWREAAENGYQEIKSDNPQIRLIKVEVEPENFLAWCGLMGQRIDSNSRRDYANSQAVKAFWDSIPV